MALTITGKASITRTDFVHGENILPKITVLYTLAGNYTGEDVKKKFIDWSGQNLTAFNPRVGDWTSPPPTYTGPTTNNIKDQYYPMTNQADKALYDAYMAKINDQTKLTLEFLSDHWTQHVEAHDESESIVLTEPLRLEVNAFDGDGNQGFAFLGVAFTNVSTDAKNDYTFHAGIPVGNAPFTRPEFYAVHASDAPPVLDIETPFYTTYPGDSRDYEHVITYSGDSSFFWDSGQDVVFGARPVTDGKITATMSVHDWAPHADYTGYTTVSAIGSVVHQDVDNGPKKVLAQDGYLIYIEYHTGTAVRVRVLQAKEATKELLVNDENKAIETHGNED